MEIVDVPQNSPEWHAARLGLPTTSEFQCLMAKSADRKGRATYMRRLAEEIITGRVAETFRNESMDRGHVQEPEAADRYSFLKRVDLEVVGFVKNHGAGCSPDRFIVGQSGLLEIKTQRADILIETILKDEFPGEHKAQTQGALWICDRDYVDLMIHCPGMPPFIKRAGRDVRYIADLAGEVARFNEELAALVERRRLSHEPRPLFPRQYGGARAGHEADRQPPRHDARRDQGSEAHARPELADVGHAD
jgi:hypothetical protein